MKNFTPVRDPVTGQMIMVPNKPAPEWGEYARSEEVRNVVGKERYDAFYPHDFNGKVSCIEDVHDATLVEITALLAQQSPPAAVGNFARDFYDAATLVRCGDLRMATVGIVCDRFDDADENEHSKDTLIAVAITPHEVTLAMFCSCGDLIEEPVAYWNDGGDISVADIPMENMDDGMVSRQVQLRRIENTRIALAAMRQQAERPEGVIDMMAFRQMRAVQG